MPEGSDNPNISIKFTPDGADEVIQKARSIKREVEGIADAAAKASQPGGLTGKAAKQQDVSDDVRRIRERRKEHQSDLEDLKKTEKFRELSAQEERRRLALTRAIRRNEQLEARTVKREEDKRSDEEDKRRMSEQRTHVQWMTRALQSVGLGKYAPGGSVGSAVLGALGPAAAGGIGGLSALAIGGLGAAAAIGVPLGLAAWGVNRTLGKNPAYGLGMEAAGYVNPFTAAANTREISHLMEKWESIKTKAATGIAGLVDEQIGYWRNVLKTAISSPENSPTTISGFIRAMKSGGESYAVEGAAAPTIGEMRMRYEMSRPMMAGIAPSSDMARMGIYARATEGEAMRSGRVWQQELIDALQRFSSSSEQRLRTAQAGGSTPASLSHTH